MKYQKPKLKYTGGKVHKPRCGAKKLGGNASCSCGLHGKKYKKFPAPYLYEWYFYSLKDGLDTKFIERVKSTVRKWQKKYAIKKIQKLKDRIEWNCGKDVVDMQDKCDACDRKGKIKLGGV